MKLSLTETFFFNENYDFSRFSLNKLTIFDESVRKQYFSSISRDPGIIPSFSSKNHEKTAQFRFLALVTPKILYRDRKRGRETDMNIPT